MINARRLLDAGLAGSRRARPRAHNPSRVNAMAEAEAEAAADWLALSSGPGALSRQPLAHLAVGWRERGSARAQWPRALDWIRRVTALVLRTADARLLAPKKGRHWTTLGKDHGKPQTPESHMAFTHRSPTRLPFVFVSPRLGARQRGDGYRAGGCGE